MWLLELPPEGNLTFPSRSGTGCGRPSGIRKLESRRARRRKQWMPRYCVPPLAAEQSPARESAAPAFLRGRNRGPSDFEAVRRKEPGGGERVRFCLADPPFFGGCSKAQPSRTPDPTR